MEDFTLHGRKVGGNKVKYFLFLIIIYPQIVSAEWVCPAPAGCKIVQDTGECIGCIEVKEEPPIIKEEKVMVEKKPVVKVSDPPLYPRVNESLGKTIKKKGVCYVEPCDWLKTSSDRKPITRKRNWVGTLWKCVVGCKVGVSYWDDGGNEFDKNLNLISTN